MNTVMSTLNQQASQGVSENCAATETLTSRVVDRSNHLREMNRSLASGIDGLAQGIIQAMNILYGPDYTAQTVKSAQADQGPTEAPHDMQEHSLLDAVFSGMSIAEQQARYRLNQVADTRRLLDALVSGLVNGVVV